MKPALRQRTMLPSQQLFVASRSSPPDTAVVRLGGVTVGAPTSKSLQAGMDAIGAAVVKVANSYPSIDRGLLISDVAVMLGHRIDIRVFGAIVGSKLRMGLLDVVPCVAQSDRVFRVLIAPSRMPAWAQNIERVGEVLRVESRCPINRIRDEIIGDVGRGMWSAASHLAARLALLGRAEYVDRFSITIPRGLGAICSSRR